ncbi:matrix metalloproteinase-28 isoform X3 [Lacerta agilis]|uniref:matrix metalloproteinase-28 isoform X3 n=1 Tax=Lacerta agilis TaxID=80427 RepID=UPI0014198414|nr:matrix metalloproteinase-28 isoform X3 [Lacerta agilis]
MAAAPILALLLLSRLYSRGDTAGLGRAGAESQQEAEKFLRKYGYFGSMHRGLDPAEFSEAIREFQWVYHLPLSGALDASTIRHMSLPRCGVNDLDSRSAWKDRVDSMLLGRAIRRRRRKRFSHQSGKWYKRHLTYRVVNWPRYLPEQQVRQAVKAAFELWSNVSSLVFWEAAGDPADIRLTFFHGDHNDGVDNAFDGPGGALAHAFFPRRGEAHFDNDERWSLDSGKGRNLFVVVAHEIGHTLGLEHSPVRSALMSPYYKKLGKDFVLNWDDILSVQNLYDLEDNLYIFKGGHYWIVSKGGNATGPDLLRAMWPGLPSTIDAAAFSEEDGKFYFFKGGRCWRYKGSSLDAGFPQKCSSTGDLPRHPDTALYFQPLHHLVLFKGPKYYMVSGESLQVEPYYPRSLKDWGGVPAMANGALTRPDGFVYFFRNDRFWKFNPDTLRVVESGKWASQLGWLGCQDAALNQAVV